MKTIISWIFFFHFGYSLAQVYKEPDMDCKKVEKIQYSYSVNYSIIDKYNKIDTSKNALTQEPYYTGIRNFLDTLVVDIMLEKVPAFGTDSKKMIKPFHAYESIFGDCFPEPCGTPEIEKFNYDWRDTTFMTITRHAREELTGGIYMIKTLNMKRGKIIKTINYLVISKVEMYYKGRSRYPSGSYKPWCLVDVREIEKRGYRITIGDKSYSVRDFFTAFMYSQECLLVMKFDSKQVVKDIIGGSVHHGTIIFQRRDELVLPELLRKKGLCYVLKQAESHSWY